MSTISIESIDVKADSEKNHKQLQSHGDTIVKRLFFALKNQIFFPLIALKKFDVTNRNALQIVLLLFNSVRTTLQKQTDKISWGKLSFRTSNVSLM